jgi:predicted AAA+ superfamily ATPase
MAQFYPRFASDRVRAALSDTRVVMITGPRQSGKTTLVRAIASDGWQYRTLDDPFIRDAARNDPVGFIRGSDRIAIDEIQRAPDLLLAIKQSVDEDRRPGRFLLTGSANLMAIPTVSESLAGRVQLEALLSLSRSEIIGHRPTFFDACFAGRPPAPVEKLFGDGLISVILAGGYPEALNRATPARQRRWYNDYIETIVQRDVADIANIHKLTELPQLLRILAEYSGRLINLSRAGGELGLHHATINTYVSVLEHLYLIARIPPWFRNELKRLIKTPKLHFMDAGLLAAMRGLTLATIKQDRNHAGQLLESFVYGELRKQAAWNDDRLSLWHYLDKDQYEVDFVVENSQRQIVGIEVKAAATVTNDDFRGLRKLQDASGKSFCAGVVLHDGEHFLPFGKALFAVPLPSLWS